MKSGKETAPGLQTFRIKEEDGGGTTHSKDDEMVSRGGNKDGTGTAETCLYHRAEVNQTTLRRAKKGWLPKKLFAWDVVSEKRCFREGVDRF